MPRSVRRLTRLFAAALVAAAAVLARAGDLPDDPEAALFRERAAAVPRLAAFAGWCGANRYPRSRDLAWKAVVRFDPENAAARRALGHRRAKSGAWEEPKGGGVAVDADPSQDFTQRRDAAVGPLRDLAMEIVAARSGVALALRETALEDVLAADPDDEAARTADRQTLAPGGWRLDETMRARVRRREIADAAAAARSALPARKPVRPDESVAVWNVKWASGVEGARTRVFGGPGASEADAICAACDVGEAVYQTVLGAPPRPIQGLTVYVFAKSEDAWAAIDRDPRFTADDRKTVRALSGWWILDRPEVIQWSADGAFRIDTSLRQTFGLRLRWGSGVDTRRGWAWEGFGHYMSETVLASHLTVFAGESKYGAGRAIVPGLPDRLRATGSDWLAEGRALEAGDAWPDFRVFLGKPLETMTTEEVLAGYLLARYLVEGRPEDAPAVVAAVGKGVGPDDWCASALRMTVPALERRLRRWIRETSDR